MIPGQVLETSRELWDSMNHIPPKDVSQGIWESCTALAMFLKFKIKSQGWGGTSGRTRATSPLDAKLASGRGSPKWDMVQSKSNSVSLGSWGIQNTWAEMLEEETEMPELTSSTNKKPGEVSGTSSHPCEKQKTHKHQAGLACVLSSRVKKKKKKEKMLDFLNKGKP